MVLKYREIVFESALAHEHVQDVLIDKRIWMIDPLTFYKASCASPDGWRSPSKRWMTCMNVMLKPELAKFNSAISECFDWRRLVHWGYGRLWRKLYVLLQPRSTEEKDAIRMVSRFMTEHGKLAWDLYAVHPIDKNDVEAESCSVCICEFEHDELVMEYVLSGLH